MDQHVARVEATLEAGVRIGNQEAEAARDVEPLEGAEIDVDDAE
jgi:hypothetical protein